MPLSPLADPALLLRPQRKHYPRQRQSDTRDHLHHLFRRGKRGNFHFRFHPRGRKNAIWKTTGTANEILAKQRRDDWLTALDSAVGSYRHAGSLAGFVAKTNADLSAEIRKVDPDFGERNKSTISSVIENFITSVKIEEGASVPRIQFFRTTLTELSEFLKDKPLRSLTHSDGEDYHKYLTGITQNIPKSPTSTDPTVAPSPPTRTRKLKSKSRKDKLRLLKRFSKWCFRAKKISEDVFADLPLPKGESNHHKPVPPEQLKEVLDVPHSSYKGKIISALTWYLVPKFQFYFGCRIGEACQCAADRVELKHGILCMRLPITKPNGRTDGRRQKWIPIHPCLIQIIQLLIQRFPSTPWFLDTGMKTTKEDNIEYTRYGGAFLTAWNTVLRRSHPGVTTHCLRSTFGTLLKAAEVPMDIRKDLMGHSDGDVHDGYVGKDHTPLMFKAVKNLPHFDWIVPKQLNH